MGWMKMEREGITKRDRNDEAEDEEVEVVIFILLLGKWKGKFHPV